MERLQASLEVLVLDGTRLGGLSALEGFASLRELSLVEASAPDSEQALALGVLEKLPALRKLDVSKTYVPSLQGVARLRSLEVLDLRDSLTPGSEFPLLATLGTLKELHLGDAPNEHEVVPSANLRFVRSMPNLQVLTLRCRAFEGSASAELAYARGLQSLELCHESKFEPLAKLTQLTELSVLSNRFDMRSLGRLKALRSLSLLGPGEIQSIGPLARLESLEELTLRNLAKRASLRPLAKLAKLRTLSLSQLRMSDVTVLAAVASLKKLKYQGNSTALAERVRLSEMRPDLAMEPALPNLDAAMSETHSD